MTQNFIWKVIPNLDFIDLDFDAIQQLDENHILIPCGEYVKILDITDYSFKTDEIEPYKFIFVLKNKKEIWIVTKDELKEIQIYDEKFNFLKFYQDSKTILEIYQYLKNLVVIFKGNFDTFDIVSTDDFKVLKTVPFEKKYFGSTLMNDQKSILLINSRSIIKYNENFDATIFTIDDVNSRTCVEHKNGQIFASSNQLLKIYDKDGKLKKTIESKSGIGESLLKLESGNILSFQLNVIKIWNEHGELLRKLILNFQVKKIFEIKDGVLLAFTHSQVIEISKIY